MTPNETPDTLRTSVQQALFRLPDNRDLAILADGEDDHLADAADLISTAKQALVEALNWIGR